MRSFARIRLNTIIGHGKESVSSGLNVPPCNEFLESIIFVNQEDINN